MKDVGETPADMVPLVSGATASLTGGVDAFRFFYFDLASANDDIAITIAAVPPALNLIGSVFLLSTSHQVLCALQLFFGVCRFTPYTMP